MTEKEGYRTKKKGHPLLILLFGVVLGAGSAVFLPRYLGQYVPQLVSEPPALEGEVMDKQLDADRLVLKVSTEDGVLLASFTARQSDVDLLVETGDSIQLEADRYRPFLENPGVVSVRKPRRATPTEEAEPVRERRAYRERMEAQLETWEEEIAELEAKAAELGANVQEESREQLEELRRRRDAAREKLDELAGASAEAWQELKEGVDRAWDELREALDDARSRFEDSPEANGRG